MRFFILFFFVQAFLNAQELTVIKGTINSESSGLPLANSVITIEGSNSETTTTIEGLFEIKTVLKGEHILKITATYHVGKRLLLSLEGSGLDIGTVSLTRDVTIEQTDNLITLTDSDLSDDDETISLSAGLLQATRDVFLNRAAFDFGQALASVPPPAYSEVDPINKLADL